MSKTKIIKRFYVDGTLVDPTSIVMSDSTDTYGVRRKDNQVVVVANNTAMEKISIGIYSIEFTDPAYDLEYEYWVEIDYLGDVYRFEGEIDGSSSLISADLTLQEMIAMFRFYIDDTIKNDFSSELIVQLLNNNQNRVLSILPRHIFPELDATPVLAQSLTSGAFDLSGLATPIWNNAHGLTGVKTSGGYFCKRISFDEYRCLIDRETKGTYTFEEKDSIYYVRGTNIYVKPIPSTIDLFYMKAPTKMVVDVDPASNVNCELNYSVQQIILGLSCEAYVDKFPEAARMYNNAIATIQSLGKYSDSESVKFAVLRGGLGVPAAGASRFNIYNFE